MSALRKVLVVDDDAVVGKSFNRVLSSKGYVVTTAQNAHEALKQIREQEFDVVFTDIKMPGMDGVELAERVKSSRPWTPVVIITGYGTTENESRAKAAGVSDFMRKPLSPEMIEASAAKAMSAPVLSVVPAPEVSAGEPLPVEAIEKQQWLQGSGAYLCRTVHRPGLCVVAPPDRAWPCWPGSAARQWCNRRPQNRRPPT